MYFDSPAILKIFRNNKGLAFFICLVIWVGVLFFIFFLLFPIISYLAGEASLNFVIMGILGAVFILGFTKLGIIPFCDWVVKLRDKSLIKEASFQNQEIMISQAKKFRTFFIWMIKLGIIGSLVSPFLALMSPYWPVSIGRVIYVSEGRSEGLVDNTNQYYISYYPKIEYEYLVEGRRYNSKTIAFADIRKYDRENIKKLLAWFYPNREVKVYYFPLIPSISVLEPGWVSQWGSMVSLFFFCIMAVVFSKVEKILKDKYGDDYLDQGLRSLQEKRDVKAF